MSTKHVRLLLAGLPVLLGLAVLTYWLGFTRDSFSGPLDPPKKESPKDTRQQEVKEMIVRYFRTWSNQDMKGYDDCFLPDASIQFIDPEGQVLTSSRRQFIASQRDYHLTAVHRATEVPDTIDIRFEEQLARVVVFWKLTAGPRKETGYDHFTLLKQDGNWRIVNLVFYVAP